MEDLHHAARAGNVEMLRQLLNQGAEIERPDEYGITPLEASIFGDCADCVQALLAAGANVKTVTADGYTPFHVAVLGGWSEDTEAIAKLLLEAGADIERRLNTSWPDRQTGPWTPLMLAAYEGRAAAVKFLVDSGAAVDSVDDIGLTALMLAVRQPGETEDKVRILLNAGADLHCTSQEGKSACDYAKQFFGYLTQAVSDEQAQQYAKELREHTDKMMTALGIDPQDVLLPDVKAHGRALLDRWPTIIQLLTR